MKDKKYPYEKIDKLGLIYVEWGKMKWKKTKVQFITTYHSKWNESRIIQFKIKQEDIDRMMKTGVLEALIRGASVKTKEEMYKILQKMTIMSAQPILASASHSSIMTIYCAYPYDYDYQKKIIKFRYIYIKRVYFGR